MADPDASKQPQQQKKTRVPYEGDAVVIRIMPRTLERSIFFTIVILLLLILVIPMSCSDGETSISDVASSSDETDLAAAEGDDQEEEQEAEKEDVEKTSESSKEDVKEEPKEEKKEEKETTSSSSSSSSSEKYDISLESLTVETEPKGDTGRKVIEIDFRIKNKGKSFVPKVNIYWYDSASSPALKDTLRAYTKKDTILKGGSSWSSSITEDKGTLVSKYFSPEITSEEIVKIEVLDYLTAEVLLEETKLIRVS